MTEKDREDTQEEIIVWFRAVLFNKARKITVSVELLTLLNSVYKSLDLNVIYIYICEPYVYVPTTV